MEIVGIDGPVTAVEIGMTEVVDGMVTGEEAVVASIMEMKVDDERVATIVAVDRVISLAVKRAVEEIVGGRKFDGCWQSGKLKLFEVIV